MMPPPAMTTSALSMSFAHRLRRPCGFDHPPHLEDHLERGECGDVSVVERRRDLDDVETDDARSFGGAAQEVERLPRRQAAGGRDLGPGSKRRVEHINVERDVQLLAGE